MVLGILKKIFLKIKDVLGIGKPNISKMKQKKDVDGLIEALSYKDESIKLGAIKALGSIGDPHSIEPLIKFLKQSYLGNYATFALAEIGNPAVDLLIEATQNKDNYVRMNSAYALGLIGNEKAVPTLNKLLKDKDDTVRMDASGALRMIASPKAVDPLIKSLKDKEWKVRENSAEALGKIGDERAIEHLSPMLNDENKNVSMKAEIALEKIKNKAESTTN